MNKVTPELLRELAGFVLKGKAKNIKMSQRGKKQKTYYLRYETCDDADIVDSFRFAAEQILKAADALEKGTLKDFFISGSCKTGIVTQVGVMNEVPA
jgi:hypothetical protein